MIKTTGTRLFLAATRLASATRFLVPLVLVGGMLAGCSSLWKSDIDPEAPGQSSEASCPKVEIVGDLRRLYRFPSGSPPAIGADLYSATLSTVNSSCTVDAGGAKVHIGLTLSGRRGPAMVLPYGEHGSTVDVTYFVAVLDASGHIIDKVRFPARLDFKEGLRPTISEELEQRIPVARGLGILGTSSGFGRYSIEIGFQLTPEELAFIHEKQNRLE